MEKEYFTTSLEHMLAELERIDLLFQLHLRMAGQLSAEAPGSRCRAMSSALPPKNEIRNALDEKAGDIWLKKAESKRRGIRLRLDALENLFDLTRIELDIFLLCLAPELDLLYERICAYLQNDRTKTRPGVELVSNMLYPWISKKQSVSKYIDAGSPLLKNVLLQLIDDRSGQMVPVNGNYLRVDERIAAYLLELETIDLYLRPHVWRAGSESGLEGTNLPSDLKYRLALIGRDRKIFSQGPVMYFQGPEGMGKQAVAQALCKQLGLGLLIIDLQSMFTDDRLGFEKALRLIRREAILQHAALYWQGFDLLLADDKKTELNALLLELKEKRGLTFLAGKQARESAGVLSKFPFEQIDFPGSDYNEQFESRTKFIGGNLEGIASTDYRGRQIEFHFSGGQIRKTSPTIEHEQMTF